MPAVTYSDCAKCPVMPFCSAHDPAGEWEHDEGKDPCVVVGDDEEWSLNQ